MGRGPSKSLRDGGFFEFKKNAGDGLCWVKNCANPRMGDRSICSKHNMEQWRAKRKTSSAYHQLKNHAKARSVRFTISRDYFQGLVDAFGMFDHSAASRREVLTIDRVDASRGYEPGNLRVVSLSENVIKGNRERYLPEHVQEIVRREREKLQAEHAKHLAAYGTEASDIPF